MRRSISKNAFPLAALAFLALTVVFGLDSTRGSWAMRLGLLAVEIVLMIGTVFTAVEHAEDIAHRVGEPYGTLILTLAVTIIESSLIVSMMLGPGSAASLARDAVFAVVMIVCNGLVGLCILVGGIHHREQDFRIEGPNVYLSLIFTLATLILVLPNHTQTLLGPYLSPPQLIFVSTVTLVLYAVFLYVQTVRHTEYFVSAHPAPSPAIDHPRPFGGPFMSMGFLVVTLLAVILLAKKFGAGVEDILTLAGAPSALAGLIIALLVLLPESMSAFRAATRNELQKSLNLALGSSLATIALTIPAVAIVALSLHKDLVLGIDAKNTVLLGLTFIVSLLTLGTGRTNILAGLIHLVILAVYVFLIFVP